MKRVFIFLSLLIGLEVSAKNLHLKAFTGDILELPQQTTLPGFYVVQFKEKFSLKTLSELDVQFFQYVPDDAAIVYLKDYQAVEKHPGILAVTAYTPALKLSPELKALSLFSTDQTSEVYSLLFFTKEAKVKFLNQHKGDTLNETDKTITLHLAPHHIKEISQFEGLEWIEKHLPPKLMVEPVDVESSGSSNKVPHFDLTGLETGTYLLKAHSAWARGYKGKDEGVAVMDTGLDDGLLESLRPDFASRIIDGHGWGRQIDMASQWKDSHGHGTHVMGSILSSGASSHFHIRGMAYEALGFVQKVFRPRLEFYHLGTIQDFFSTAYVRGFRVHSNSWGANVLGKYTLSSWFADEFVWQRPDMLLVFAAGNSGEDYNKDGRVDQGSITSPGTAKNVLTVGASEGYVFTGGAQNTPKQKRDRRFKVEPLASSTYSDSLQGIASFSSRGPTQDGRLKPEIVATGTNVLSTCLEGQVGWGRYDDKHCFLGGTSMATPLVSGGVAAIRQYLKKVWNIRQPSSALLKAIVTHTAEDLFPGQFGFREKGQELLTKAPNHHQGFGRMDLEKATRSNYFMNLYDQKKFYGKKEFKKRITIPKGVTSLKVTLFYVDAPPAMSAKATLVNDLDLSVTLEDGTVIASQDRINNFEQIQIDELSQESVIITVTGHRIAKTNYQGEVPFAFVVSENK